ncbi:MAG TPA: AraC family transcriptional regulator [Gammaproteobacteria bacterium]|nr:AraC family transcriptional regulator [Gammaproteobacteria bacterium]
MKRRRPPRLVSTQRYKDYVPGKLLMDSQSCNWQGLLFNAFELPAFLPEGPAPGIADYTFGFVYEGGKEGEFSINQGAWTKQVLRKGSIVMAPPDHAINWRWLPETENAQPLYITCAYLSSALIKRAAVEALDTEPACIEMPKNMGASDAFMEQLFLAVKNELQSGNPCGPLYAQTAAQMLALHLLSNHCTLNYKVPQYKRGIAKIQLRRVLEYIHMHLDREITLESLSLIAGLSQYHFLRMFKQSVDKTPLQYIIHCRMEKAKCLLAQTGLTITEIALEVGYESLNHFITLFKRHTGTTPAAFRKAL